METNNFDKEAIKNIVALGEALRKVHNRLISEGYVFKDGKITPPPGAKKIPSQEVKLRMVFIFTFHLDQGYADTGHDALRYLR